MFLILFRNILCPQQMFPSLRSPRNIMSNNVSATMCPRLPVALDRVKSIKSFLGVKGLMSQSGLIILARKILVLGAL